MPPASPEPRRPHGPRNPADAWAEGPKGRFWGLNGAAGLLVHDPARGVLLQHRVSWSDHGGTWGLPGGARHAGEDAILGAFREAGEEAGVPARALALTVSHVFDVGYWSYTTVIAEVVTPFEPVIGDAESVELVWVPPEDVDRLPLHPGVERMWPQLRARLEHPAALVVDVANVMGSRPDGWWTDRAGAAARLLAQLDALASDRVPGAVFGLGDEWHLRPTIVAVVEGRARDMDTPGDGDGGRAHAAGTPEIRPVGIVRAERDGDSAIVDVVRELVGGSGEAAHDVTVVTSDRGLRGRVEALTARVVGAGTLLRLLHG